MGLVQAVNNLIFTAALSASSTSYHPSPSCEPNQASPLQQLHEARITQMRNSGELKEHERVGAMVTDAKTGEVLVCINPDEPMQAASTIKVPLALAVAWQRVEHAFEKEERDSLISMIRNSSNHATNYFMREVGGAQAAHNILRLAYPDIFHHAVVAESIPTVRRPRNLYGRTYGNLISQSDQIRLLQKLHEGTLPASEEILGAMRNSLFSRVRHSNIPRGEIIRESKTGTTGRVISEIGIIKLNENYGVERVLLFSYAIDRSDEYEVETNKGKYTVAQTTARARFIGNMLGEAYRETKRVANLANVD